jgi:hypothetical protein
VGVNDEMTGQAVYAFVTLKPEYNFDPSKEDEVIKELTLQVRKNIGPFASPKKMCVRFDCLSFRVWVLCTDAIFFSVLINDLVCILSQLIDMSMMLVNPVLFFSPAIAENSLGQDHASDHAQDLRRRSR